MSKTPTSTSSEDDLVIGDEHYRISKKKIAIQSPSRKEYDMGKTLKAFSPPKRGRRFKKKATMVRTVLHFDIDGKRKKMTLPNDDDDLEDVLDKIRNIISVHEDASGHDVIDVDINCSSCWFSKCLTSCLKGFLKGGVKDNAIKATAV